MHESAAMVMQLIIEHPEAGLAPPVATPERTPYCQWCIFGASKLDTLMFANIKHTKGLPEGIKKPECRGSCAEGLSGPGRVGKDNGPKAEASQGGEPLMKGGRRIGGIYLVDPERLDDVNAERVKMAFPVEVVVDRRLDGGEHLKTSHLTEAQHRSFPSSKWKV